MELDLIDVQFDLRSIKPRELEEALEDPFSVRFLPDSDRSDGASRYYSLGRTVADRYLFFCFGTDGKITRNSKCRVSRGTEVVYEGKIASLKHVKEDVREVTFGMDCGIKFDGWETFKEGDVIAAFEVVQVN